jgi:oxygen-dependent protoporphyrinogen oxidase
MADELTAIRYSSSVTVTLGYGENVRKCLPPGFGFLVPRSEGTRMLAATFVHNKFPHRAPPDRALIRCFLGGSRDEQVLELSDQQILDIVRSELKKIIKLDTDPLFARVYRWKGSMAQYGVGHLERLERIEHLRLKLPGLALAGNGYSGIGVPDVSAPDPGCCQSSLSLGIKADEPSSPPRKVGNSAHQTECFACNSPELSGFSILVTSAANARPRRPNLKRILLPPQSFRSP